MICLTTDKATEAFLSQTNELAEIRDTSGNPMGFFVPVDVYKAKLYVENQHSYDFVKMLCGDIRKQVDHQTLRQIYEHLKTLTDDHAANADLHRNIERLMQEDRDEWARWQEPPAMPPGTVLPTGPSE